MRTFTLKYKLYKLKIMSEIKKHNEEHNEKDTKQDCSPQGLVEWKSETVLVQYIDGKRVETSQEDGLDLTCAKVEKWLRS